MPNCTLMCGGWNRFINIRLAPFRKGRLRGVVREKFAWKWR